jgi:AraC family transcriptional regulator
MSAHLNQVQNWLELAKRTNWSVLKMARLCGVSPRTLERHFKENTGKSPKIWLNDHRQKQSIELLQGGLSIKETAAHLGYKYTTHFAQEFKRHWGCCPAQFNSCSPDTGKCRISI